MKKEKKGADGGHCGYLKLISLHRLASVVDALVPYRSRHINSSGSNSSIYDVSMS